MSLRICRHCRKPVSLKDERCPHCKGELKRGQFILVITIMAFLLLLALSAVVYGALVYRSAYEAAYCRENVYTRITVEQTRRAALCARQRAKAAMCCVCFLSAQATTRTAQQWISRASVPALAVDVSSTQLL
jgi:hypothetical protein